MSYVLLRSMKVQCADGRVELRPPGARVPEAANWPNPGVWVKRGYMRPENGASFVPGYDRSKLRPARPATPEDAEQAVVPVPQAGEPLSGNGESTEGNGESADSAAAVTSELLLTEEELLSMKNADLEELGLTFDLQFKSKKKADMVAAILAAQGTLE